MSKPRLSVLLPALTAMAAAAAFVLVPGGVANFLAPFAGTAWLFLRVFVLSIDQSVYWILVICAAVFVLAARLSRLKPAEEEAEGEAARAAA